MSEGDPPSVTDDEAKSDALDALISEKEVEDGTSAASFIHQLQIVAQAGGRIEELFVGEAELLQLLYQAAGPFELESSIARLLQLLGGEPVRSK